MRRPQCCCTINILSIVLRRTHNYNIIIEAKHFIFYCFETTHVQTETSRKLLRVKVTPDLQLTYSKIGENLGLVLKMKNRASLAILLTKHVKYTYLYLFKFVLYSILIFKAN